jgi:nicotinamide-nucleotide amidase
MFPDSLLAQAERVVTACRQKSLRITTAESCTGGLLSGLITSVSGASDVFYVGFVSYSNIAKIHQLEVPESLIETHGAVSEHVAKAMAEGALTKAHAHIALSITGVAGPGGGSAEKPVGLVYIACATPNGTLCSRNIFTGDRQAIRLQACSKAIEMANSSLRA